MPADESEALLAAVGGRSAGADWIACCGSLPRGPAPECSGVAALAAAVAHGAAAVQPPGSLMPTPADLASAAVTVTGEVPRDRVLTEPVERVEPGP
ncbi:hypothetical protein [Streptomyces sp. YGL11-2]|uniref:hypothetical protein n=1 Tax=Streptomyces sp. YGL11-2 TaxID=3414028 RepID=UPI003CF5CDA2